MKKCITVFIPVYNGDPNLEECIRAVLSQEIPAGYDLEFMITDTGSKDKSVEIIKSFGDKVIFDEIPNSEFGHGKTRQRAVERAHGEYILFLSQDATPASTRWLIDMIEPFKISDSVGCVFGRQIPRAFAAPTLKREVADVFYSFGPTNAVVVHNKRSLVDNALFDNFNYFMSDVNSAIRKDLNKEIPFRDVAYAEDQALAEDMMTAGYLKAYSARGAVYHTNEYTYSEYYHRKFDEYLGLQNSTNHTVTMGLKEYTLGWVRPTIRDWKFTLHDGEYNKRAKIKFFVYSVFYNINEKRAKWDAIRYKNDHEQTAKRSLEKKRLQK